MRSRSILLLALALGCGLVASIGISQVLERRQQIVQVSGETVPIFVAMHDIAPNDLLTPQNVKLEEWPKEKVPTGAITHLKDLENQRCRIRLFAGEPILQAKIINSNDINAASRVIPKGYRVVAVRIDVVSGGGSLIVPGDRVDVLVYLVKNPSHDITETKTKTILQDIKVFAVDAIFQRSPDQDEPAVAAKTISLLVTPDQAEKVTLASEMGAIRLVLRNDQDSVIEHTEGADASRILGAGSGSNRAAEQPSAVAAGVSSAAKGLLDLIKQQRDASAAKRFAREAGPWKMILYRGSDVAEMSVDRNGLPTVVDPANGSASLPAPTMPDRSKDGSDHSQDSDDQTNEGSDNATQDESAHKDASSLLD